MKAESLSMALTMALSPSYVNWNCGCERWPDCPSAGRVPDGWNRSLKSFTYRGTLQNDDDDVVIIIAQIFIDDRPIGGFDELYELEKSGDLDRLMASGADA